MKNYLLIKKISIFEKLAQVSEEPYTMSSEHEMYGEGSKKKDVMVPNEYITNLTRDSLAKYDTLSPEEKHAIDWWIGSSDAFKNPDAYRGDRVKTISQNFDKAIGKFVVDNPTEKHPLIKRFQAPIEHVLKIIKEGEMTLQNDTSASYKSLDKFGPHELIFRNVSKAYSLLGPNPGEAEMIIPKGTKFKILNSKQNNRGGYIIELTEIN